MLRTEKERDIPLSLIGKKKTKKLQFSLEFSITDQGWSSTWRSWLNKAFSPTWPAAVQIYWIKRQLLHETKVGSTPTYRTHVEHQHGRRFINLNHQYGGRGVMWKRSNHPMWGNPGISRNRQKIWLMDPETWVLESGIQWNPALWPPRYYSHFFLAAWQNDHTFSRKKPLLNTANFFGLLVTVLTEFLCTSKGIRNPTNDWNLESRFLLTKTGIQYLESEIHGVESGIQHSPGFP